MRTLLTALPRRVWLPVLVALAVAAVALGVLLTSRDDVAPRPAAAPAGPTATPTPTPTPRVTPTPVPAPPPVPSTSVVPPPPPPSTSAAPRTTAARVPATSAPRSTTRPPAPATSTPPPAPAPPPPPAPAPPPPPAPAPAAPGPEGEVLALVNTARAAAGCGAVSAEGGLAGAARAHSADMRDRGYFSHTGLDGRSPFDRAPNARAENIAKGQPDAGAVVRAWMDSPGHRENILNCSYRTMGVGLATGAGGPWWTQLFGG